LSFEDVKSGGKARDATADLDNGLWPQHQGWRILMLKLKIIVLSFALAISVSSATRAQVTIDVSKITCDQFLLYKVASPDTIAIWLHGYFSGRSGQTIVDVEALKASTKKVRDYCLAHGDVPLMQAVQEVLNP